MILLRPQRIIYLILSHLLLRPESCIRPPPILIHLADIYIAIFHLSLCRDARMRDFRNEHDPITLFPVTIWRTLQDLSIESVFRRVRYPHLLLCFRKPTEIKFRLVGKWSRWRAAWKRHSSFVRSLIIVNTNYYQNSSIFCPIRRGAIYCAMSYISTSNPAN